MKSEKLMKALSCIDQRYIQEAAFDTVQPAQKAHASSRRRLAILVLAACLVFALAATAYAGNLFGIRELFGGSTRQLPEEAIPYIQPETAAAEAEAGWSCAITESLCDASTVMATVTVSGGSQYIVAPTDAGAGDTVGLIGLSGSQTLEDYAASQGKKLLLVGASLTKVGDESIAVGSQNMRSVSESEMTIMVQGTKSVSAPTIEAFCTIYARESDSEEVQRVELPFTLTEAPAAEEGEILYRVENPDAIPGMTVGDLHLTQTPLGINIRIPETVTNEENWQKIMKVDMEGLTYGEGGSIKRDDGNWYFEANMCQGTIGNTLVVHYYNWNKDPIGDIVFHKVTE